MSFEDDLATDVERNWADVQVALNGHLHVFRFTALDGLEWANQCDNYPIRPGVTMDSAFGYDLRALTVGVAPLCAVRMVDGEPVPLRVDAVNPLFPKAARVDEWRDLFAKLDGAAIRRMGDTIWALNEQFPLEAVAAAKKALAGSAKPSRSRSSSVSPRNGSSAGSRKKSPSTSTTLTEDSPVQ